MFEYLKLCIVCTPILLTMNEIIIASLFCILLAQPSLKYRDILIHEHFANKLMSVSDVLIS